VNEWLSLIPNHENYVFQATGPDLTSLHHAGEQLKNLSSLTASKAVTDKHCEELQQEFKQLQASVGVSDGTIQTLRQQIVSIEEVKVRAAATGDCCPGVLRPTPCR
jgi:hypothetical protein